MITVRQINNGDTEKALKKFWFFVNALFQPVLFLSYVSYAETSIVLNLFKNFEQIISLVFLQECEVSVFKYDFSKNS